MNSERSITFSSEPCQLLTIEQTMKADDQRMSRTAELLLLEACLRDFVEAAWPSI
jgi:hypothetical protein